MQYIHLNDDTLIIQTSKGPYNLSRTSFNFNKIKKLITEKDMPEKEILELLKTPELPDGIYQAYLTKLEDKESLLYTHVIGDNYAEETQTYFTLTGNIFTTINKKFKNNITFLGVYASMQDLVADWPEYAL